MSHGYHPPVEEYLEAVLELAEDGVEVIQARIAERLNHSAPTVSETIRRLRDEGYLTIDGRKLSLTERGHTVAEGVVRKHRLAERLLVDVIGMPWDKSHDEATRWEHVISDEVEAQLIVLLGEPETCPHGNPIPGIWHSDAQMAKWVVLSELREGDTAVLRRVSEQAEWDGTSLPFLASNGFLPGTEFRVTQRSSDGSITVAYGDNTETIGRVLCGRLYVAPVVAEVS